VDGEVSELAVFDAIDAPTLRDKVLRLEQALLSMPHTHIPEDVHHHFAPGVYMRELRIPKGAVLTGKIHRTAHLNILAKGDISVMTEHGVKRLVAPCVIESAPGIKRAGYAHEDCVWICVHPTTETDLAKLEEQLIAPSFEALGDTTVKPDLLVSQ
jgi:hypothetical protein